MYKKIIEKLLAGPQKGQIQIDFDLKKKVFRLSVPIYSSKELPTRVKDYVLTRKDLTFKPHTTSFYLAGEKVILTQELPFPLYFQTTTRKDVDQFCLLAKHCYRMLAEIALEETYKDALYL